MAYQVTARKWRPQRFSDMVGQEHIARTLRNAIVSGRIAHAYLFVGPRGIGKTTSARIFAKALNCKHPIDGEPCCECSSCKAIAEESSVDVIEIDAATHTQVEKARDICEDVLHLPIASKYKIYIIDEVHMLSKSAWNALLKTIEEPPAHAKFIFATTEVNKVLPTVISRCQRFDLCRIPAELIARRLEYIASQEKINISRSALDVIARAADGGMRDAQSLLDQLVSFFGSASGDTAISEEQALSLFGLTAPGEMEALLRAILTNDRASTILSVHQFAGQGKNLETLFEEILTWLRGILLTLVLPDPGSVLDESPEKLNSYRQLAAVSRPDTLQILLEQLAASSYLLREAINKQVFMETILLKAMRAAHAVKVEDLLIRLNEIRRNGELNGIEKIPTLAACPVVRPTIVPPPPAPASVPMEKPIAVTPPESPSKNVVPPPEKPVSAPSVMTAPPPPPAPPKVEVTDTGNIDIPLKDKELNQSDGKVTDAENPVTASADVPVSPLSEEPAAEDVPEDFDETGEPAAETASPVQEDRHSMSLKERFSPELLWKKLIGQIQAVQPSLADIMSAGLPDRLEKSLLYVFFDAEDVTMLRMITREKPFLVQELRRLTKDEFADLAIVPKDGLRTQAAPKRTLDELKRDVSANPMVQETADLFRGEIVDVLE
ncbi:MAG: DNA polymerase III subunit gamma/tau [Lentisphaeria bacterium]|nr:DNA polymerase III subunit gamma/tau [Lentisphaeria bacterium]